MVALKNYEASIGVPYKTELAVLYPGQCPHSFARTRFEVCKEIRYRTRRRAGTYPIVSLAKSARQLINRWQRDYGEEWKKRFGKTLLPSAVVVETPRDAGGHLGAKPDHIFDPEYTLGAVTPGLVEMMGKYALDCEYEPWYRDKPEAPPGIPVIPAGGIWDINDIKRMLALGAGGVQMATRFIATDECNASEEFKRRHMDNPDGDRIVVMTSPVGMPGRAYENELVRRVNAG